jgi:HTH-type transcriptional regulator, competence development regulator
MSTERIGEKLRRLREENQLPLRKVAAMVDIDVAILNKMERGERQLTKEIVKKLAELYNHDTEELLVLFLRDKVLHETGDEELAIKALHVAEEAVSYKIPSTTSKSNMINSIKTVLKNDGRVAAAWLFGSFAKGDAKTESDVDIMVEFNNIKKYSFFDLADIAHRIEKKINKKVDLVEKGCLKDFAENTAQNEWKKIYG